MVRLVALLSLIMLQPWACKTSGAAGDAESVALDFDTDADAQVKKTKRDYAFCPNSSNFNIVNAYWLAVASSYVYAKESVLQEVVDEISTKWKGQASFFSNDTDVAYKHHSQAMWVEFDQLAILSFRGTQFGAQDLATDLQVVALQADTEHPEHGKVHAGFREGLNVIWPQVKAKLMTLKGTDKPLYITGHSLGGALAVVATSRIFLGKDFEEIARRNLRGLYTYGAPRVGDEAFASSIRNQAVRYPDFHFVRVRNFMDIVTRIPSSRLLTNYEHIGPLYYLDEQGRLYSSTTNVNFRRLFMTSDIRDGMFENDLDYAGRYLKTRVTDHFMDNYIGKLDGEYGMHLDWTSAHSKDLCDMGMYAVAWAQDPQPPEIKPFTNDAPVAQARQEGNQTVKSCCWCQRTWYYSDWGRDTPFKQENFVGVIQEGEIASGNCMYPGGKAQGHLFWQGKAKASNGKTYDQYYTYSACEAVTLVGDRCTTGQEIYKGDSPSGKIIKAGSWAP